MHNKYSDSKHAVTNCEYKVTWTIYKIKKIIIKNNTIRKKKNLSKLDKQTIILTALYIIEENYFCLEI